MYLVRTTCSIKIGCYIYTDVIYGYVTHTNNGLKCPLIRTIKEICLN